MKIIIRLLTIKKKHDKDASAKTEHFDRENSRLLENRVSIGTYLDEYERKLTYTSVLNMIRE